MAANLDRAETSLTAVRDIAYIRGIDGSGNSVRISKADLASVLGANRNSVADPSDTFTDFNDIMEPRNYRISSKNYSNAPTGGSNGLLIVFVYWLGSNATSQTFISSSGIISQRVNYGGTWQAWKEYSYDVPTFYKNYASIAALAAGIFTQKGTPSDTDANNLKTPGIYAYTSTNWTNVPEDYGNGFIMVIGEPSGFLFQFIVISGYIFFRRNKSGSGYPFDVNDWITIVHP